MIADLKPHSKLKDSGVPWLGMVPVHWDVTRGKAIFRCIDVRSSTGVEELLTVSSDRGVVLRSSASVTMFKAESYVGYKLCWPGDLVINSLWAWGRGLGVARHHGIVSSAYGVYRLRQPHKTNFGYIHELVRSAPFNWELQVRSKGIWVSRLQLTDEAFLGAPFPIPPADEQAAIVRFLDHSDRRIRRYIRAKQKLIKLLEEQKQAIIHRAVTRGLDPNVRLKPSGVAWLGEVPEHWEVRRMKRVATLNPSKSEAYGALKAGAPAAFLPMSCVGADGRIDAREIRAAAALWNGFTYFRRGDVLVAKITPCFENGKGACLDTLPTEIGFGSTEFIVARATECLLPRFLYRVTTLAEFRRLGADAMIGAAGQQRVPTSFVADFHIPLPSLDEQAAIVRFLDREMSSLAKGIEHAHREITLLREYRTRLIADVVTGKLDVREAAARLPQDAEDLEPLDEAEVEGDAQESDAGDGEAVPEEAEA